MYMLIYQISMKGISKAHLFSPITNVLCQCGLSHISQVLLIRHKIKRRCFVTNLSLTVVCEIVHKFASVWCKTALGEVGVSVP